MSRMLTRNDKLLVVAGAVLTGASGLTTELGAGPVAPFVVSAIALGVLAAVVGRSVDQLGERFGAGATGVVQSALGNLPELFFGIFALRAGLVGVVQATLVGSILANVLFVLGLAFVVGGRRHGTQRFDAPGARNIAVLLLLAVGILIVPGISAHLHVTVAKHEDTLSTVASAVLLAIFALSLPSAIRHRTASPAIPTSPSPESPAIPTSSVSPESPPGPEGATPEPDPRWPVPVVLGILAGASVAAAFVSDWFVTALTPALSVLHMSQAFAGLVVVAIAGNAVENVVGVQLAAKNRPDYALSVILQSPVQIAFVLMPMLVLVSPAIGGAHLTLVLPAMLLVVTAIAAVIAAAVVFDGESTWLEGVCLVGLYAVIATAFWWG